MPPSALEGRRNRNSSRQSRGHRKPLLFIGGVLNLLVGIYLLCTWYMHTVVLLYEVLEMWWCLTDDGLQRLTQSRGETSSSLTDDGLDDGGLL